MMRTHTTQETRRAAMTAPAVASTTQRHQQMADNSQQAAQLKRVAAMMAAGAARPLQRVAVTQLAWNRARADLFVNANVPLAGETPAIWKARIQALLNATDYVNDTDKDVLGAAFARYHRNNFFTAANAATFINGHPPVRPQTLEQYKTLHDAALLAAGHFPQISNALVSDAYEAYWVAHPFDAAAAGAYFLAHPPTNAPQTATEYFVAHADDLATNWHVYSALRMEQIVALFLPEMTAFRTAQGVSTVAVEAYYTALGQQSKDHIFNGGFNNGGPKGIHAYTNGALPAGAQIHQTLGNTADVHAIIWSNAASRAVNRCKWSSMFPIHYSRGMVAWYVLNHEDAATYRPGARPTAGIPAWLPIIVGTAGNTEYPIMDNVNSAADIGNLAGGSVDAVNVNHRQQYRWNGVGGIRYVIDN